MISRLLVLWIISASTCLAQASDLRTAITTYVAAHQQPILAELVDLLSIPNVAADSPNIGRNARHIRALLEKRGFTAEILETGGNPLVYGEMKVPGAAGTLLFYIHYDGQPVDPSRWRQPGPFQPILRDGRMEGGGKEIHDFSELRKLDPDWRIYARSASDDKSPLIAFCTAVDALREAGLRPTQNVRIILDGEEEAGSPSLTSAIDRYREKLTADTLLILDGPVHPSGRPTLNFGARGIVTLELTVYGPKFALHSGHYGNWIPNPALRLAQLLASMKDDRGRVRIPGFYDGIPPLTPEEQRIQKAVPDDLEELNRLFGVSDNDAVGETLQESLQYPSLNIRGLRSAYVGADARTIIPAEATAAIDIRLVKETPSDTLVKEVEDYIRKQGYHLVDADPGDALRQKYPKIAKAVWREATEAFRTDLNTPAAQQAIQALRHIWGQEPVLIRTSGGTVPISPFIRALGFPAINVPTVNFDNNQHGENENLRLGHLWNGIVTIAGLLVSKP